MIPKNPHPSSQSKTLSRQRRKRHRVCPNWRNPVRFSVMTLIREATGGFEPPDEGFAGIHPAALDPQSEISEFRPSTFHF